MSGRIETRHEERERAKARLRAARERRQQDRRERRQADPSTLRLWIRWGLRKVGALGRDLAEDLVESAIDHVVDHASAALDFGDSPLADEAEDVLEQALEGPGRATLRAIAHSVLDEDRALRRQGTLPRP